MILRSWHGVVPSQSGDDFERYFRDEVLSDIESREGNLGAFFRRHTQKGYDHFFLLTYWKSWTSIHEYAGDAAHLAVSYPEDGRFGLISDPLVLHQPCSEIAPWFGEVSAPATAD